jgi:hypothetical protein
MPFIVTTKRLGADPTRKYGGAPSISRRAVATLEEACAPYATPPDGREEEMAARVDRATTYDYLRLWDADSLPLTLSDGTVIEVVREDEGS